MPTAQKEPTLSLMEALDAFIKETQSGKRLQTNGKRITTGTITQYECLRKLLYEFETQHNFPLRIRLFHRQNKRVFEAEKKYWNRFYRKFLDFLYDTKKCYDNYVGAVIRALRVFFNYLQQTKGLPIGNFHKTFYAPKEEVQIVVLSPEQLQMLIDDKAFEDSLPAELQRVKDVFVFGCTVALRFSDLMNLQPHNLEIIHDRWYLKTTSIKTQTPTRVLLPDYAKAILKKYLKPKQKHLLPLYSKTHLNAQIKALAELAGWTTPLIKTRNRRGVPQVVYKESRTHYRFCDRLTTHTMRRTAITTMLSLGMPEHLVRKVSGHAPGSKEFFRYVSLSQTYLDTETSRVFDSLASSTPKPMAANHT
jgi:integrase